MPLLGSACAQLPAKVFDQGIKVHILDRSPDATLAVVAGAPCAQHGHTLAGESPDITLKGGKR